MLHYTQLNVKRNVLKRAKPFKMEPVLTVSLAYKLKESYLAISIISSKAISRLCHQANFAHYYPIRPKKVKPLLLRRIYILEIILTFYSEEIACPVVSCSDFILT